MFSMMLRSTFSVASAATIAIASLTACTDPFSPDDSAAARSSSSSSTTNPATGEQFVIIALTAPADAAFRSANGKAKFKSRGGERELEIEVEDVRAGTVLVFFLDGAEIGRRTASALGNANLELNSDRGGVVPASVSGKSVAIRTSSGATVVTGSL